MPWIEITEILVITALVQGLALTEIGGCAAAVMKKIMLPIIVDSEIKANVHLQMTTRKEVHVHSVFRTFMKIDLLKTLIIKVSLAVRKNIW